ncbi:hypothetical protein CC80DRAFT_488773 [Byssothecium circinans]|uniref:F-box domain-containing protein n=1 Tax=Byssothecium circinans TaxID=147558 RepID=A0A6A5U9Y3_9PLEO|nr:hypothetical protein CC80DRAFT_488773 [Byssothecium circinans]
MPSMSALSVELVEQIISYLDQPALYALCRVTKSTYNITEPFLYRHVDLLIPPGKRIPRIDKFLLKILNRPQLAKYVKTLRVGLSPEEEVSDGQRFLQRDNGAEPLGYEMAMELIHDQPLVGNGDDLREALYARDYGAYAAMLLLTLPSLHRLEISDHENESLRPFHRILENVHYQIVKESSPPLPPSQVVDRIGAIEEMVLNCNSKSGYHHESGADEVKVHQAWKFPGVQKLEFMIPHKAYRRMWMQDRILLPPLIPPSNIGSTCITNLVIRHSSRITECLRDMFAGTHQLRSLTCEIWHDASPSKKGGDTPSFSLNEWSAALGLVQGTLERLVISVELCDSEQLYFKQPKVTQQISGSLDLRTFDKLTTLECPMPFISGDYTFLIIMPIEPCLPPGLQHVTIRTDISSAQFPYPFDTSILPSGLTYGDAQEEAQCLMSARMDVSYLASASLSVVDQLDNLKSISVWQPPDPSLNWFDSQLDDLATTCKNRGITAKALYPLAMRWKSAAHWNLVNEVSLFDPQYPESKNFPRLYRGEREGIPLGLATQYHLSEFKKRHVKRSQR